MDVPTSADLGTQVEFSNPELPKLFVQSAGAGLDSADRNFGAMAKIRVRQKWFPKTSTAPAAIASFWMQDGFRWEIFKN